MTKLYVCEISNLIEEIKADESAISAYFDKLERGRIEHILKHNKAEDRARTLGVSLLLLFALRREGYKSEKLPDFSYMGNGKPYIPEYPDLQFNLSHSKNIIACVISNLEVGVDVEHVREIKEATVRKVFSEKEREIVGHTKEGYVRLWTIKEACAKLTGIGMADIWSGLQVLENEKGCFVEKLNQDIRKTSCYTVVTEGYLSDSKQIPYFYSVCANDELYVETIRTQWDNKSIKYC